MGVKCTTSIASDETGHAISTPRVVFAYLDIRYPDIRIYPLILWQPKIRIS